MNYKLFLVLLFLLAAASTDLQAQTIYLDPVNGKHDAPGTQREPVSSLHQAAILAHHFSGLEPITMILAPGLYTVTDAIIIGDSTRLKDTSMFSIRALVMPDDSAWQPEKMPVIQCIADGNREGKLTHASIGFNIKRNNVHIEGLKFIGNPNPAVGYYYAIERRDSTIKDLYISRCYFIADRNSTPMQGAVFAQGPGIRIDHCIFYGCKNAVMAFWAMDGFTLTHSIIYGAYEGAVWHGYGQYRNLPFTFRNNIVAKCNYFWIGYKGKHTNYKFANSLIVDNEHYIGVNGDAISEDKINKPQETGVRKTGKVLLNQIIAGSIPRNYLHLSERSDGRDLDSGIF